MASSSKKKKGKRKKGRQGEEKPEIIAGRCGRATR